MVLVVTEVLVVLLRGCSGQCEGSRDPLRVSRGLLWLLMVMEKFLHIALDVLVVNDTVQY